MKMKRALSYLYLYLLLSLSDRDDCDDDDCIENDRVVAGVDEGWTDLAFV
jgi:hypothetical protein